MPSPSGSNRTFLASIDAVNAELSRYEQIKRFIEDAADAERALLA